MGSSYLVQPASQLRFMMKVALYFVAVVAVCNAESWLAGPYTLVKRAAEPQRTRFFTGNRPLDAGIAGAAAGVATQQQGNQQQDFWWTDSSKRSPWIRCRFCWCRSSQ